MATIERHNPNWAHVATLGGWCPVCNNGKADYDRGAIVVDITDTEIRCVPYKLYQASHLALRELRGQRLVSLTSHPYVEINLLGKISL